MPMSWQYAINLCDVLLYPTQAENLSLTCLNALACGVPVISYDAGGQKEAIRNGYNGFIVDINDEEGMISHLKEMMKNPIYVGSYLRARGRPLKKTLILIGILMT